MKKKTKYQLSTKLGVFITVATVLFLFLVMFVPTVESFTFDMQYLKYGFSGGIALVLLPEDVIVDLVKKYLLKR